ncbi:unnamed protein product [Adineta ricciae]|uniref:G-protein coupled receptors family 1 profile domain-containing protein n=1 Tax=Adineta ricciae TaxID=249248 RepID=A0A815JE85_ADIRI|nr:unnamed protein product [Adineta ricciae]
MFGLVHCNASLLSRQVTDPKLFFVRSLVKNWLWPIITFFGVTGNILVIIVLTKRRMIMSSTNNYLVALALVDIAYLTLTLILNTLQHPCFYGTTISDVLSTICRPIADLSSNTSVWLTVTFTVERWVAITYPLKSRTWCTVTRARKIILSVLCAALICTLPSAFEMKLVRVTEIENSTDSSEKPIVKSRIRAKATALGSSLLYHQIYFNFVTFAIIWIPLLLLIIFNTILIIYVHRSKQEEHKNKEGIKLRRHNRGNQGEQRKTTIMLIGVVIVFTVCQIPQAISLTLQSFFPVVAQTSKVLIYNNFANCLVAINASMNFLLYCCFSSRFRSTCRSSFAIIYKHCANFIDPNWKLTKDNTKYSISFDNMSSTYSLHGQQLSAGLSNQSSDLNNRFAKYSAKSRTPMPNYSRSSWAILLSKLKSHQQNRNELSQMLSTQSTETFSNSSAFIHQSCISNHSLMNSPLLKQSPTDETIPLRSPSMNEEVENKQVTDNKSDQSNQASRLHPFYHSHRSLRENSKERVWIKRRLSSDAIQTIFNRQQSFLLKDIVDVTV